MRKNGGIFQKWFTNFTIAVFTQSLHAVMLLFLLKVLAAINNFVPSSGEAKPPDILMSVITFFCVTGITRTEKIVKSLFGIQDSEFLGATKDNMVKSMHAVRSAANMGRSIAQPVMKGVAANKKIREMRAGKIGDKIKDGTYTEKKPKHILNPTRIFDAKRGMIASNSGSAKKGTDAGSSAPPVDSPAELAGNMPVSQREVLQSQIDSHRQEAEKLRAQAKATNNGKEKAKLNKEADSHYNKANVYKADLEKLGNDDGANQTSARVNKDNSAAASGAPSSAQEEYYARKNKEYEEQQQEKEQKQIEEYNAAIKQRNMAIFDSIANAGSVIAGVGVGAGMDNDLADIVNIGNALSQPFVKASTAGLNKIGNVAERNFRYETASGAVQADLAMESLKIDTERIVKEATEKVKKDFQDSNKEIQNAFGKINPKFEIAVDKQIKADIKAMNKGGKFDISGMDDLKKEMQIEGGKAAYSVKMSPDIDFKFEKRDKQIEKQFMKEVKKMPLKSVQQQVIKAAKANNYNITSIDNV